MQSKYPNTYYRVSLKAIIRDDDGNVLVVKENGSAWSLPGGGIDHGENLQEGLAREMYEEVLIEQPFTATVVGTDSFFRTKNEDWLMWIVCELEFPDTLTYGLGADADEVMFIDPEILKDSDRLSEQLVYKWCRKNK